jgi:hypothetical protein
MRYRSFCAAAAVALLFTAAGHAQGIFWADTLGRSIYTAGFDGSNPHTILTDLPADPRAIAVDPLAGKLYVAFDGDVNQVWRTNLDGSSRQTILDAGDGPDAIALDSAAGKMYLALEDTQTIKRANLDGSGLETLHAIAGAEFTALMVDPEHAQMYWLDRQTNQQSKVFRSSITGGAFEEFVTEPGPNQTFGNLFGLAFEPIADHVYLLDEDDSRIYRASLDGDILDFLQPTLQHPRALALLPDANQMLWVQNDGIYRSDLNGQNVHPLVGGDQDGIFPLSLAVIPEPASWLLALMAAALAAMHLSRWGGLDQPSAIAETS